MRENRPRSAFSDLLARQQNDDDEEDDQPPARVITPTRAVGPCRQGAEDEEYQEDDQQCSHHGQVRWVVGDWDGNARVLRDGRRKRESCREVLEPRVGLDASTQLSLLISVEVVMVAASDLVLL
jgi:hypothetical protein